MLTNIALIDGLQDFLGAGVTSFGSGNIILGGNGSDIIEGRGGDDLIDGDRGSTCASACGGNRSERAPTGAEIASFDSLTGHGPVHARRAPTIPASSRSCARS